MKSRIPRFNQAKENDGDSNFLSELFLIQVSPLPNRP